jgi:hypothetical protein
MNRDDIIRMAKEAGHPFLTASVVEQGAGPVPEWLERFAALVAAAEREACAKVCERMLGIFHPTEVITARCAKAIRARGEV